MDSYLTYLWPLILIIAGIVAIIVPVLLGVAYLTLYERKVMSAMQRRQGPALVGPFGLLQPIADGLKLLGKEWIIPSGANAVLFIFAPFLTFFLSLVAWAVMPFSAKLVLADINVGLLYLYAISSLGVYGLIVAGWASNSRYAFLGGLRSAAQMVSYEVSMGLIMVSVLLCVGSFNLNKIVMAQQTVWFAVPLFPMFITYFISILAETNRHPFDLPEGESEIVAGFFTEYSSMNFACFMLGEYANMIMMSAIAATLFLGGWLPPLNFWIFAPYVQMVPGPIWLALKVAGLLFVFIWARAAFPRYRYDQLMRLGWKVFLPLTLGWLVLTAGVLVSFGWLPKTGM
ncbi:MAG: NADH-quinone oxidoreductase subunit NuoH [Rhodospirillaceae bacterium]